MTFAMSLDYDLAIGAFDLRVCLEDAIKSQTIKTYIFLRRCEKGFMKNHCRLFTMSFAPIVQTLTAVLCYGYFCESLFV